MLLERLPSEAAPVRAVQLPLEAKGSNCSVCLARVAPHVAISVSGASCASLRRVSAIAGSKSVFAVVPLCYARVSMTERPPLLSRGKGWTQLERGPLIVIRSRVVSGILRQGRRVGVESPLWSQMVVGVLRQMPPSARGGTLLPRLGYHRGSACNYAVCDLAVHPMCSVLLLERLSPEAAPVRAVQLPLEAKGS